MTSFKNIILEKFNESRYVVYRNLPNYKSAMGDREKYLQHGKSFSSRKEADTLANGLKKSGRTDKVDIKKVNNQDYHDYYDGNYDRWLKARKHMRDLKNKARQLNPAKGKKKFQPNDRSYHAFQLSKKNPVPGYEKPGSIERKDFKEKPNPGRNFITSFFTKKKIKESRFDPSPENAIKSIKAEKHRLVRLITKVENFIKRPNSTHSAPEIAEEIAALDSIIQGIRQLNPGRDQKFMTRKALADAVYISSVRHELNNKKFTQTSEVMEPAKRIVALGKSVVKKIDKL